MQPSGDHQKIHPLHLEAPPPSSPHPTSHIDRSNKTDSLHPPGKSKPRRSCSCGFICWTLLLSLLLLVLVATAAGILYLALSPKLPTYSVDRLRITNFTVDPFTLTARASLALTVTASNPNRHISIYYEEASLLSISYSNSTSSLCTGAFPVFYQGRENVTVVDVVMSGETRLEGEMLGRLGEEERNGMVPLRFRGEVPVRVQIGWLRLWKVFSRVRCDLRVSSLSAGDRISIKTSTCKFGLKL